MPLTDAERALLAELDAREKLATPGELRFEIKHGNPCVILGDAWEAEFSGIIPDADICKVLLTWSSLRTLLGIVERQEAETARLKKVFLRTRKSLNHLWTLAMKSEGFRAEWQTIHAHGMLSETYQEAAELEGVELERKINSDCQGT